MWLSLVVFAFTRYFCFCHKQHIEHYEIVEPVRISSNINSDSDSKSSFEKINADELQYTFSGYGRMFHLRISRNDDLLGSKFSTIVQNPNGEHQIQQEKTENCYYHGYVEGQANSYVTVSTCNGLRGVIYDLEEYFIEPTQDYLDDNANGRNPHLLYKTKHIKMKKEAMCGGGEHATAEERLTQTPPVVESSRQRRSSGIKRYIEAIVVLDNRMYQKYGMNGGIQRAVEVMNYVDFVYKTLDTRVALTAVVVWNVFDMIKIDSSAGRTLSEFKKYTSEVLRGSLQLSHDNAQLITDIDFDGNTVGLAPIGVICSTVSCAINQNHNENPMVVGNTVAHEMGHNLGLYHYDRNNCSCTKPPCVMTPTVNSGTNVKGFSSCSIKKFDRVVSAGEMPCVDDYPEKLFGDIKCGNGYREKGEECDCGTEDDCKKSGAIACCDHKTCTLKASAQCADGLCCQNCKFKEQGSLCRGKVNSDCDLEEYCTGTSDQCPRNFYRKDGTSCEDGKSYCFKGSCKSLDKQCQTLWGPNAVKNPIPKCYELNTSGDKYSNCGKDLRGTYVKCKPQDVLCGTLQCAGKSPEHPLPKSPIIGSRREIQVVAIGPIRCVQGFTSLGAEIDSPTVASAGTKCAEGKVCFGNVCTNLSSLSIKECSSKCLNGGVCNNNGNCHCKPGYACPYCELAGPGGSFDSGQGCLVLGDCECLSGAAKAILVLVFVVLPICVVASYVFYRYKRTGSLPSVCCKSSGKRSGNEKRQAPESDPKPHISYEKSDQQFSPPLAPSTIQGAHRPPPPPPPNNKPTVQPRRTVYPSA